MNLTSVKCFLNSGIMNFKIFFAVVTAGLLLSLVACKRDGDRNSFVYDMLKSQMQNGDTIKDLNINWKWKARVVNSDLYKFDIKALNKRVSLTIDSINNHTTSNVEMTLWNILGDDDIRDMFDIFKCWVLYGKYHWVCRPIHNAFGYEGDYRINSRSVTQELLVVFSLDSTYVSVYTPSILDNDYNIMYVGKKIGEYVYIYRNIDRLLNIADSLDVYDEQNERRGVTTIREDILMH